MSLAIVGAGNMGGALAQALVETQTLPASQLLLIEPDTVRRRQWQIKLGCQGAEAAEASLADYQAIVLAVKPQIAPTVMPTLAPLLQPHQVVISIMAGISTQQICQALRHPAVVRVMPNTPAQIQQGMSVYFATSAVSAEQVELVRRFFQATGKILGVAQEEMIDAATALSGSGPAYLFYIAEHMLAAAKILGFNDEEATLLVQQTLKGSALLWESQTTPVELLRKQVTSPGGTTEAAVRSFDASKIGFYWQQGIQAAYQRAKELARPA